MLIVKGMVRIQNDLSGEFVYGKGVLQGDHLSCLLFILALEKAMRNAGIDLSLIHISIQMRSEPTHKLVRCKC